MKKHGWIKEFKNKSRHGWAASFPAIIAGFILAAAFSGECAEPGPSDRITASTIPRIDAQGSEALDQGVILLQVKVNDPLILSAVDPNCPNCSFQWLHNGQPIDGETGQIFTNRKFEATDGGAYAVVSYRTDQTYAITLPSIHVVMAGAVLTGSNSFGQPKVISDADGVILASNIHATSEPGEPNHADWPAARSIWFKWSNAGKKKAILQTAGSTFATRLAVYAQTNKSSPMKFEDLELVTSDERSGAGLSSRVEWDPEEDADYFIAVDGAFEGTGGVGQGITRLGWDRKGKDGKPTIRKQPEDQQINVYEEGVKPARFKFSVSIMNKQKATHTFDWYRQGRPTPVFSETHQRNRSEYTTNATTNAAGLYYVDVKNGQKKTTSRVAELSLTHWTNDTKLTSRGGGNIGTPVRLLANAESGMFTARNVVFDRYLRFPISFGTGTNVVNKPGAANPSISKVGFWTTYCQNVGLDTYILTARTTHPYSVGADSDNTYLHCSPADTHTLSDTNHVLGGFDYNFTIYYRFSTLPPGRTNIVWGFYYY